MVVEIRDRTTTWSSATAMAPPTVVRRVTATEMIPTEKIRDTTAITATASATSEIMAEETAMTTMTSCWLFLEAAAAVVLAAWENKPLFIYKI